MHSSGLIQYWINELFNPKGLKVKSEDIEPQVLTMEHVTVGFLVCLCPLASSIIIFIFEIAVYKLATVLSIPKKGLLSKKNG